MEGENEPQEHTDITTVDDGSKVLTALPRMNVEAEESRFCVDDINDADIGSPPGDAAECGRVDNGGNNLDSSNEVTGSSTISCLEEPSESHSHSENTVDTSCVSGTEEGNNMVEIEMNYENGCDVVISSSDSKEGKKPDEESVVPLLNVKEEPVDTMDETETIACEPREDTIDPESNPDAVNVKQEVNAYPDWDIQLGYEHPIAFQTSSKDPHPVLMVRSVATALQSKKSSDGEKKDTGTLKKRKSSGTQVSDENRWLPPIGEKYHASCMVCDALCIITRNRKIPSLPFCKRCKKAYFYQISRTRDGTVKSKKPCAHQGRCDVRYDSVHKCNACHLKKFQEVLQAQDNASKVIKVYKKLNAEKKAVGSSGMLNAEKAVKRTRTLNRGICRKISKRLIRRIKKKQPYVLLSRLDDATLQNHGIKEQGNVHPTQRNNDCLIHEPQSSLEMEHSSEYNLPSLQTIASVPAHFKTLSKDVPPVNKREDAASDKGIGMSSSSQSSARSISQDAYSLKQHSAARKTKNQHSVIKVYVFTCGHACSMCNSGAETKRWLQDSGFHTVNPLILPHMSSPHFGQDPPLNLLATACSLNDPKHLRPLVSQKEPAPPKPRVHDASLQHKLPKLSNILRKHKKAPSSMATSKLPDTSQALESKNLTAVGTQIPSSSVLSPIPPIMAAPSSVIGFHEGQSTPLFLNSTNVIDLTQHVPGVPSVPHLTTHPVSQPPGISKSAVCEVQGTTPSVSPSASMPVMQQILNAGPKMRIMKMDPENGIVLLDSASTLPEDLNFQPSSFSTPPSRHVETMNGAKKQKS